MSILLQIPRPHEQTAGRVIDGEAVLMLSDANEIVVLNHVGARIYELADGARTVATIAATITAEYAVSAESAEADVSAFIADLVAQQILVLTPTSPAP